MSEEMITTVISALLSIVSYFAMRWLEGINKQLDELESLIDDLTKKVAELERRMATKQELASVKRQLQQPQIRSSTGTTHHRSSQF